MVSFILHSCFDSAVYPKICHIGGVSMLGLYPRRCSEYKCILEGFWPGCRTLGDQPQRVSQNKNKEEYGMGLGEFNIEIFPLT